MAIDTSNQPRQAPPKLANTMIRFLLRSPLHGMISNVIMLLNFKGRKTGKEYSLPIGYMREGNTVTVFTDHKWWKNLRDNAPVTVVIKGKKLHGTANAIPDDKELTVAEMQKFLTLHTRAAQAYRVTIDPDGKPDAEAVRQAAQRFTMIRILLFS